jgi:hypothetical protein
VLPKSEIDDSRPILFRPIRARVDPSWAKIDNVRRSSSGRPATVKATDCRLCGGAAWNDADVEEFVAETTRVLARTTPTTAGHGRRSTTP